MFEKLFAFADLLDEKGLKKEADEVDLAIKEAAPIFNTKGPAGGFFKSPGAWKEEQKALREKGEKIIADTMKGISENPIFKTAILGNDFAAAKDIILSSLDRVLDENKEDGVFSQLSGATEAIKRTVAKIEEEGSETIAPVAKVSWPQEELVKLVQLINSGKGIKDSATELGKTPEEVRKTVEELKAFEKLPGNKNKSISDFIAVNNKKPYNPACQKLERYIMSSFMSHSGLGVFTPSRFDEPKSDSSRLDNSRMERYREEVDPRVKQRQEEIRKKYDASLAALMKLADTLDGKGLKAEADEIDNFIKESSLVKMAGPWDLLAVLNNSSKGIARDESGKAKVNPAVDKSKLGPYQLSREYFKDLNWVLSEFCRMNDVSKMDEKEKAELHQEISEMTGESNWSWPVK